MCTESCWGAPIPFSASAGLASGRPIAESAGAVTALVGALTRVEVDADGVTLYIDLSRSDLLVETEMLRFAVPA